MLLALAALTLGGGLLARTPRDLAPRPPDQRTPDPLFPPRVERPAHLDFPRVPPPDYAYYYREKELEAYRQGKRDPWEIRAKRKTEGWHPQPGVALGDDVNRWFGEAWPERRGPRDLQSRRDGSWPKARISPEDGFLTGDKDYHFHPDDPRSDTAHHQRAHRRQHEGDPSRPTPASRIDDSPAPPGASKRDLLRLGRKLFEDKPALRHPHACASCHGEPSQLREAFLRYPAYDGPLNRVIGLEDRINICRTVHQSCTPWRPSGRQMVAMLLLLREAPYEE